MFSGSVNTLTVVAELLVVTAVVTSIFPLVTRKVGPMSSTSQLKSVTSNSILWVVVPWAKAEGASALTVITAVNRVAITLVNMGFSPRFCPLAVGGGAV